MNWQKRTLALVLALMLLLTACDNSADVALSEDVSEQTKPAAITQAAISDLTVLEPGLSSASFTGDDGFENFLSQGGASSDAKVARFLSGRL